MDFKLCIESNVKLIISKLSEVFLYLKLPRFAFWKIDFRQFKLFSSEHIDFQRRTVSQSSELLKILKQKWEVKISSLRKKPRLVHYESVKKLFEELFAWTQRLIRGHIRSRWWWWWFNTNLTSYTCASSFHGLWNKIICTKTQKVITLKTLEVRKMYFSGLSRLFFNHIITN